MSRPVRRYKLPEATVCEYADHVHTRLSDGSECVPAPVDGPEYGLTCLEMGYPATAEGRMRYAVEHEIVHHLIAKGLFDLDDIHPEGEPTLTVIAWKNGLVRRVFSRIIFNACHGVEQNMEQPQSKAEEHLVNRFQRWVNLGERDPFGELERKFNKKHLAEMCRDFLDIAKPWTKLR